MALLKVQVEPRRQRVDRVVHFYHPERTFIKKHFTFSVNDIIAQTDNVAALNDSDGGTRELFACCSDPNAIAEVKTAGLDPSLRTLYLKAPVKESPGSHSLYVMLYNGKYLVSPLEVWLVVLHPVCRFDQSVVIGQSSEVRMMLRGDPLNRRVACYSFSAPVMKVGSCHMLLQLSECMTVCIHVYSDHCQWVCISEGGQLREPKE